MGDARLKEICFFMELAPLGDMMDWSWQEKIFKVSDSVPAEEVSTTHFTEEAAKNYFKCLLMALQCLHENLIAHLDVKPQNLLLFAPGLCKLTDFGTCLFFDEEDPTLRGTYS